MPAGTSRLFDSSSNNLRAINVTSPLSITTPNLNYITIGCDAFTKTEINNKFSDLVNSAPTLLDTLGEISAYLGIPTNTSTNLISLISNKANSSDTFYKSKTDNDYYLSLGNKRFSSLGTTENKLIFEIQDTMGTFSTDAYYPALTFQMNTITKQ